MTNYGEVFEVWFDGANGGDGWYGGAKDSRTIDRKTYYNYPRIYEILDKLQPQAIVFSDGGPGCRWVGNENGFAGATNWSFLRAGEVYPGYPKLSLIHISVTPFLPDSGGVASASDSEIVYVEED